MPWFWKPYTSDTTDFIAELRKQKPSLEEEQRRGRALLWDKRLDGDALRDFAEGKVDQQPYVYMSATTLSAVAAPQGGAADLGAARQPAKTKVD